MMGAKNKIPLTLNIAASILSLCLILPASGQILTQTGADSGASWTPAPPGNARAFDFKYDRGEAIEVKWSLSADDDGGNKITGYEIFRAKEDAAEYKSIAFVPPGIASFVDGDVEKGKAYRYKIGTAYIGGVSLSQATESATAEMNIVNWNRLNLFIVGLIISGAVIYFIAHAKKGKKLFIRKIAGLEAIDEAIGRATEMGRPILFIPGINDMDDVQTIAGITLLGRVAKVVADYDIKINMPVSRSLVMTTARETIREAYVGAGRPDAYSDDMVRYVTDEQFGYVAAVDGIMVRERPATCFYLGAFFAESLILAETGNSIGAIQIAGTAQPAQLPFFVAACDYTLIGEELFAASAYLSNEPKQLGSLKGQDVGKLIAMVIIILGALSTTVAQAWDSEFFAELARLIQKIFTIQN
jgi:hypothetical protein